MTSRGRSLTALGAYVCLAAQLLAVVHLLVVRHATCPDHGEVTHGVAHARDATRPTAADRIQPGVAADHADEHCLFVATRRREMASLHPAAGTVVTSLTSPERLSPPGAPPRLLTRVLRLAPKTSPPAA
jgi:hypothetical protein